MFKDEGPHNMNPFSGYDRRSDQTCRPSVPALDIRRGTNSVFRQFPRRKSATRQRESKKIKLDVTPQSKFQKISRHFDRRPPQYPGWDNHSGGAHVKAEYQTDMGRVRSGGTGGGSDTTRYCSERMSTSALGSEELVRGLNK
ncbi:hypothetical protein GWI33_013785 [Rhynchophorus ferrugineus]|uniref:Uncharacterized protein n=1 Tax=Rhynchophorus ferrugineus TaxID=354439 RepID=A0A834MCY1_RHYFE|nr:hypothetical protein GWI33_013785 [Rhynchophorus ferrugineus]